MLARKNKSDDGNISRRCQTANLTQNLRQGTADGWRKHDGDAHCAITCTPWGVSTSSCRDGQAAAATACRAANTPPASTYRTNAENGMRHYTRMHPATSHHAALMKSDIRILTGLSHSISGFGKNSILTSLCATHALEMGGVGPFAFRYQGNGATACQYIDTTRKAINCATTLSLTVFI